MLDILKIIPEIPHQKIYLIAWHIWSKSINVVNVIRIIFGYVNKIKVIILTTIVCSC